MAVTIICDDCRKDMTDGETICRSCVEARDEDISALRDELKDVESERDDFASQLEDYKREKSE